MNSHRFTRGSRQLVGALAISLISSSVHAESNDVPTGSLNIDRDLVREGVHSQLDWNIEYPSGITEIVEIAGANTIVPKKNLTMKVRVLGVAFQTTSLKSNNGHGNNLDGVDSSNPGVGKGGPNGQVDPSGDYDDEGKSNGKGSSKLIDLPLDAYMSINGSDWTQFFYGTGPSVVPSLAVVSENVKKGDLINFGARGWASYWLPFHHTGKADPYVAVLKNGDQAPEYAPAYNQGSVTKFLRPYINAGGKVTIGERDLIVLWEASTSEPGTTYFDMQDLVILLTFE